MTQTIVTHNAKFHSDDVFAVATLLLLYPEAKIIRTRDEEEIKKANIVVDVGGIYNEQSMRFDHHQIGGAGKRDNGVEYASFGLVWKKFGEQVAGSKEVARIIDQILVQSIDAGDNGINTYKSVIDGIFPYTINGVVDLYRSTWKEVENWDNSFLQSVEWAKWLIQRQIKIARDDIEAETIVKNIYEKTTNKSIIIIDEKYDFGRESVCGTLIDYPEPMYAVLFRSDSNNWQVVTIRKEMGSFENRKSLPEVWKGKQEKELSDITGVEGCVFCHRSGFMCVVKTKEGAEKLAEIALNA